MRRLMLAAAAAFSLAASYAVTFTGVDASPAELNIPANVSCRVANGSPCPKVSKERAIAEAKMAAAMAYSEQLEGRGPKSRVDSLEKWARALSGEAPRPVVPSSPSWALPQSPGGPRAEVRQSELQSRFWMYRQVNSYYCAPATVQSILRFLGPDVSKSRNAEGGYDRLTGDEERDQKLLATTAWLSTDLYEGTMWGSEFIPATINAWRGTQWYVSTGTPNIEGGTLTKEQALAIIKFNTDRSYPVAENVEYSSRSYYPAGFYPGITYYHWDVIYGHYKEQDGRQMVQVGQTYSDQRLTYERFQNVPWDLQWGAISIWYGLVW